MVVGGKVEQEVSLKLLENESAETTSNFIKAASFCFELSKRDKVASFASSKLFMIVFCFSTQFTENMNQCNWLLVFDAVSSMIKFVSRHAVPKCSTPHNLTNGRGKLRLWSRRCRQTV